jgi:hypothetical protein
MRVRVLFFGCAVAALTPATGLSQDARVARIFQRAAELEMERRAGVRNYTVVQNMMGTSVSQYYERFALKGPEGKPVEVFRLVHPGEVQQRREAGDSASMSADELEVFADASEMLGDSLAGAIEKGLSDAGLPPGLLAATTASPHATMDPRVMMRNQATFLRAAADAKRQDFAGETKADARRDQASMAVLANAARLVGVETIGGRPAFHVRAEGLKEGNEQFTVTTVSLWIDTVHYVPLHTKMEGVARSGRESKRGVIERIDSDYRTVPGSRMYEPYKQTMRMAGVLDARQEAEMRKAQQQMAEFEQRLAKMPAEQRQMAERMMGSQMAMMRKMAAGGGIEMVTEISEIRVNAGPPGARR